MHVRKVHVHVHVADGCVMDQSDNELAEMGEYVSLLHT